MGDLLNPLSLTRELLKFNTINPPGNERKCAEYLAKLLVNGGFKTEFYDFEQGRTSLIARKEGEGKRAPICFTGHIDTVPLGNADWTKDPFCGEVAFGKVYGRGSADMKGGIAAMICACLRLDKFSKGKSDVMLVFTAGEETGNEGARHLVGIGNALGRAGASQPLSHSERCAIVLLYPMSRADPHGLKIVKRLYSKSCGLMLFSADLFPPIAGPYSLCEPPSELVLSLSRHSNTAKPDGVGKIS